CRVGARLAGRAMTLPDDVTATAAQADDSEPAVRWEWVRHWQQSGEPPAWGPGVAVAIFVAIEVGVTIAVLTAGLAGLPWLAAVADVIVILGVAPALWMSRRLPVLRWLSAGAAAGLLAGIVTGWALVAGS